MNVKYTYWFIIFLKKFKHVKTLEMHPIPRVSDLDSGAQRIASSRVFAPPPGKDANVMLSAMAQLTAAILYIHVCSISLLKKRISMYQVMALVN